MHKVAFEDGGLPDRTTLAYYAQGKALKWDREYFVIVASFCYMNSPSLCNKRASVPSKKVMACAASAQMVGNLCFVMDAQEPSTKCEKKFRRERYVEQRNIDAVAAGRVLGADPIAQLTGGSISMVKHLEEAEVIACIICR
ncbi:hypothetical protein Salat_2558300 [Sesamum alatum]|uniref:Uncharacterized protein n=1 Tax=Sesamum alatum TaxID=300844 RepID=A0AAE1XTG9_9LAMI|nr:hypothetical protein Salat_2558300 [Sesamum alatum]